MKDSSFQPLAWIDEELARLDESDHRRRLVVREGPQAAQVSLAGKPHVDFSSNDYLGLAGDPRLADAARHALTEVGWGSGASPLITGRGTVHAQLEERLTRFEGTAAALLFPSGFAANSGTIPTLVGEGDAIFSDERNHASIIDGCRLSGARRFVYPHCNATALEGMLRTAGSFRRRLIVTDSLFSMDGDLAPLVELADLAREYQCMLMVDEAHATGVFGAGGRGVVEHLAAEHKRPDLEELAAIRIGTLSKALGTAGGFVCGSQALIDWITNRARSYVFSTAQPAAASAAALAALDVVEEEPARRRGLLARADELRAALAEQGWDTAHSASQIIPIVVGPADRTMQLAGALREAGYLVPGIRPPSVPEGESLLRVSLCSNHTQEMIDGLLGVLSGLRER